MPTALTRWDPFTELTNMRNIMDRLFEQSFGGRFPFRASEELGTATPGLDVYETGDHYMVEAALPGVEPNDVDINIEDDLLTIRGEYQKKEESGENQYLRRELTSGSFQRSLRLPPTVDAEHAEAQFENGILKLSIPKKPEAKARSFKITPKGVTEGKAEEAPKIEGGQPSS